VKPQRQPVDKKGELRLEIARVFAAPRDLVWQVWTEPEHICRWWGPRGFTTRVTELEFEPGGRWRYLLSGTDGAEYPSVGEFREIVPGGRIVTTDEFDEGFALPSPAELPSGIVMTVNFADVAGEPGRTRVTLEIAHPTTEDRRKHEDLGVVAGWNSSLDRLEEYLGRLICDQDT